MRLSDYTGLSWSQSTHLGDSVNATLDPFYVCFLDGDCPTTVLASGHHTIDFAADLSAHLISGLTAPCVLTKPNLIASRPGGKLLNGQRRDIKLATPYVRGTIGIDPGDPSDHLALLKAAYQVTNVWIVTGGAFPAGTPGVWPFIGDDNLSRYQLSAIFATSLTLKKQQELRRAELVSGAMTAELQYYGTLAGIDLLA